MSGGASGHRKSKHYSDVKGIKVGAGKLVPTGTLLTREGDRWRPGKNVGGKDNLFALCEGKVTFTRTKNKRGKLSSYINIIPVK
ncbi:MAG: 50S ribosomal protein L27 [Candidatus Omnitrophica bacterium]|nr:50S ribosomal protein L27 [Candidatus Omnitrophota bacterium]MDD5237036.1 50S ribosomal protein L27 [Candidatus Omnitrophota bacterium]MDD5611230.1 50S ribosomal protein L27 [Candidatus Omnitrophota bacterium]